MAIAGGAGLFSALRQYGQRRLKRIQMISKRSMLIGNTAQIENKILIGLRNRLLWWMPQRVNGKQGEAIARVDF